MRRARCSPGNSWRPGGRRGRRWAARSARKFDPSFLLARLDKLNRQGFGSNALAVGKDLSANGRGLLLGNPHYPWTSADRFYQAHLTVPGSYDAMGVIIGGIPAIVIGFNKDIAWSHTVTTASTSRPSASRSTRRIERHHLSGRRRASEDELEDGQRRPVTGGRHASKRSKTFWFSQQGAVIVKPEAGMTWTANAAYVLADPNRNNTRMLEQWLGIGKANNVQAIKASLDKTIGLPWVNTLAADRDGNVLFADASVVPHMGAQKSVTAACCCRRRCCSTVRAAVAAGAGRQRAGRDLFPRQWSLGDRSDYVGNSNDSYWLNNPDALLSGPAPFGYSPLYGRFGVEQSLRTRIGFLQFEELAKTKKIGLSDMQALAFANRLYAAELVLPELLTACTASTDAVLLQACTALSAWIAA